MKQKFDPEVFSAMQLGEPIGQYTKTVPSKVHVIVLNSFNGEPEGRILFGEAGSQTALVSTWSVVEDQFFQRMNLKHFQRGTIRVHKTSEKEAQHVEETLEQASDEVLVALLNGHFKKIEAAINKTDSEAVMFRLISLARANEKSERIVSALETRLAEIQQARLTGE